MPAFKIELPESFDIASRGKSVTIDVTKLTPEIVTKLALHGIKQKVADAAAGAAKAAGSNDPDVIADAGKALMQKVVDTLERGEWGIERGSGADRPAHWGFIRRIIRAALTGDNEAKYKAIPSDDQRARADFLDALFDGLADDKRAMIEDTAKTAYAEEVARKARMAKIAVDL